MSEFGISVCVFAGLVFILSIVFVCLAERQEKRKNENGKDGEKSVDDGS